MDVGVPRSKESDIGTTYTFQPAMAEEGRKGPQYLAATAANLATMTAGCILGWSSPTLPKLKKPDSFLPVSESQSSWIGSLVPLGAAIGPFPGGFLAERIGRKWTMLSLSIPFLLSWILITAANSVGMIYAGRLIGGIAVGSVFAVAPMYVGEIAEDSIRGALGSLLNALITVGFLYEYTIGPYVPYIWLGIASIIVPCAFVLAFFFMPDSPYFLLAKGKKEEASKALQWLRGKSRDAVAKELDQMQESVEESSRQSGSFKDLFATEGNKKALYLSWGLVAFQQLSGINAILFYSTDIFQLSGGSLPDEISTIIVGTVMLLAAFCTPLLVERLGRRVLLFISATGMAFAQFILGLFFYLKTETTTDLSSVGWLPVLSLVFYISVYSIGYGPLPWAVMGELFPSNVKSIASASTASFCWLLGFLITRFFQDIVDAMGTHTAFWIFAACCVLADIFVFFLLPETKGKSLQEIQEILNEK